jgi:glycosyltransferase involved in cell wall biosynthesis
MSILFSVVVPTYNRWSLLKQTLASLSNQTLKKEDYEIIVVDDGSTDETEAEIKKLMFCTRNLRYFKQKNSGPATARNTGILHANGEIIAFIDSDAIADKAWLENAKKCFDKTEILALEGKIEIPKGSEINIFSHYFENLSGGLYQTCNMFFKKDVLLSIRGFDTKFEGKYFFREDSDLFFSLIEKGHPLDKIPFSSEVTVYHPPRKEPPLALPNKAKRYQWDALLYKKHPKLYKKYIGGVIDGNSLIILLATILLIVALITRISYLFVPSILIILLMYLIEIIKHVKGKKYTSRDLAIFAFLSIFVPYIKLIYLLKGNIKHRTFVW